MKSAYESHAARASSESECKQEPGAFRPVVRFRERCWTSIFGLGLRKSLANVSLLLLAFPRASGLAWLGVLAIPGWLFDVLENANHFRMAGTYPALSPFSLRFGPLFTLAQWVFALTPLVVALLGFALWRHASPAISG